MNIAEVRIKLYFGEGSQCTKEKAVEAFQSRATIYSCISWCSHLCLLLTNNSLFHTVYSFLYKL